MCRRVQAKEVIAVVRPEKWLASREAAMGVGADEMVHLRVTGRGRQQGLRYLHPHGEEDDGVMPYLPKRLLYWLVPDETVGPLVNAVIRANKTDGFGDGKIFVCPVESAEEISSLEPTQETVGV